VNENQVRDALAHIGDIYDELPPFERKKLIRLVLTRAEASPERLQLAFRGRPPDVRRTRKSEESPRSETSKWLPKRNPLRNHRILAPAVTEES